MPSASDDIPVVKTPLLQRRLALGWLLPVLLIAFIAHSVWVWNQGGRLARQVGRLIIPPPPPVANYVNIDATIFTGPNGEVRLVLPGLDVTNSEVRDRTLTLADGEGAHMMGYIPGRGRSGFWAITRRFGMGSIHIMTVRDGRSPRDDRALRQAFIEHLQERGVDLRGLDLVPTGRAVKRMILWTGYLHDAVTLSLLAALTLFGRMMWHARRWKRRLAAGLCPACKYPLPHRPHPRCPECGWGEEDEALS